MSSVTSGASEIPSLVRETTVFCVAKRMLGSGWGKNFRQEKNVDGVKVFRH